MGVAGEASSVNDILGLAVWAIVRAPLTYLDPLDGASTAFTEITLTIIDRQPAGKLPLLSTGPPIVAVPKRGPTLTNRLAQHGADGLV